MSTEYLPPENEQTALAVSQSSELAARQERIRIECSHCSNEVGFVGTYEHARSLLEKMDWKLGQEIVCPDCVKKAAREFFNKYNSSDH